MSSIIHRITFLLLIALPPGFAPIRAGERPNVLLVMVDDMGFSDLGYHGGEIETPNIDKLAHGGVRFSQFYNSGRCCPTRATLLTGLHPHETGIGWMTQPPGSNRGAGEPPAYRGHLNKACVTIAEALKTSGYATMMSGKWHLGADRRENWPLQRGFDQFYGCLSGATRFFYPEGDRGITLANDPLEDLKSTTSEAYYTTDAFTDYAINFIGEHIEEGPDSPFFLYLAYTAPHWPLQAFEDDIAKYRGKYKMGWESLRQERFRRQIELGLIGDEVVLSPPPVTIPSWDSLSPEKQDEMDLKMAVYAAMIDRMDWNVGRLVNHLREQGVFEDTMILFLSDNGACQEGGMLGRGEFIDVKKRNQSSNNSYGEAWANAGSTPFRYYKHFAHEGGTATPFFIHWPAGIQRQDEWYSPPAQIIDVMPTILDVAGAKYPVVSQHGNSVPSLDGISLRPAFSSKPIQREEPIFVEHETNAFVRKNRWKLVGKSVAMPGGTETKKWELYDMSVDRTETNDLANSNSEKVEKLAAMWEAWAERVKVYPRGESSPRVPKSGSEALVSEPDTPTIMGREFTLTATVRSQDPDGVVIAQGGSAFGYSLYFEKGVPTFAWRNRQKLTKISSPSKVSGKVVLKVSVLEEKITLHVNEEPVAETPIQELMAEQPGLGLFLGGDGVHAVSDYKVPNRLSGQLIDHRVDVTLPK